MTKLLYKKDLTFIIKELNKGKIIAFPTDTVFGLACIYDNKDAIKRIFKAKGRDFNKALPLMPHNIKMLKEYAYINNNSEKIIRSFMPGPLTIILKKKDKLKDINDKETIAIRIPDDKWLRKLIKELNKPLLVTSANISNEESLKDYKDVYKALNNKIDYIIRGKSKDDIASTIVDATKEIKIIREGKISKNDILEVLK